MQKEYNTKKRYPLNGRKYYFNYEAFFERFDACCRIKSKKMIELEKEIATTFGGSYETVEGWRKGNNSPKDLGVIQKIAKIFIMDYMDLLIPEEEENKHMKEAITDAVREAAKNIYCKLCELIDAIEWPGDPAQQEYNLEYTSVHLRELHLNNHEDHRHYLKMLIRKSSFDLPRNFRKKLEAFVDECIGPYDEDYPFYQYFFSDTYNDYLEDNAFDDNVLPKHIYTVNHVLNMYKKLDEIFADYICN